MSTGLAQNLSFILLGEDKSATKTMTGAQAVAEKVTGRIGGAFQKVGGIIGGEFGSVLDQVGSGIDELGAKGAKLGSGMQAIGAVAATAGVALLALGSKEREAQSQLQAAIKTTGDNWDDYSEQIDAAIKKQENYDHSAADTQTALRSLVSATGSTKEALKQMSVVSDLAAAKHETLAQASLEVSKILNGAGGKTLTAYGITMEKAYDNTKDLQNAQLNLQKSTQKVSDATDHLKEIEAIDADKKKLTIAQQYQLASAHKKVQDAEDNVALAQQKLNDLQGTSITKTEAGMDALTQLAAKLKGQASGSVNSFGAQLDIVKTKFEDWVDEISGPVGTTLTTLGTVTGIAGTGIELFGALQQRRAARDLEAAASTTVLTTATVAASVATDGEAVAMTGLDAAMDANPIGLVAGALGLLVGIVGGTALLDGMQKVTKSTTDYTQALNEDSDAIGKNTTALATNALLKDGALAAAQKLGISTALVVEATLGEVGARKKLNDIIAAKTLKDNEAWTAQYKTHQQFVDATDAAKKNSAALGTLGDAVGAESKAVKGTLASNKLYNSTLSDLKTDADKGSISLKNLYKLIANPPSGKSTIVGPELGLPSYLRAPKKKRAGGGRVGFGETTLVGEDGPEVVELPAGSMVSPNSSRRMSGGGGLVVHLHVAGSILSDRDLEKAIQNGLEKGLSSGNISKARIKTALGIAS